MRLDFSGKESAVHLTVSYLTQPSNFVRGLLKRGNAMGLREALETPALTKRNRYKAWVLMGEMVAKRKFAESGKCRISMRRIFAVKKAPVAGDLGHRQTTLSLPLPPPPTNQETRQRGSGGCFYGDDLTEGMVRTKPGTIHTYIYYIQRRSPAGGGGGGGRGGTGPRDRKRPVAPPTWPRPLPLPRQGR